MADQYGYNISVLVVDNGNPETALSDLEILTSHTHFELVVLVAGLDWAVKGALRQVSSDNPTDDQEKRTVFHVSLAVCLARG